MVSAETINTPELSRDEMIEKNIGLVHSCAHKLSYRGAEYDDLFQAGCVGLIKAVDAFNPDLGFCFSTYAVPVILGEMKRLFRDGGTVKVSRSLKELSLKVSKQREIFAKKYSREPTISELAKLTESDEETVSEAICASMPTVSLTPQEETPTIEIPTESPEESLCDRIAIEQALYRLEKTEREIVVLRFFKYKTQTETAELLGMTQVQVSRKEKKILEKLRKILQ